MANMNTIAGFANLPQIANPGTTGEFVYKVPAAGVYPGLPSPVLAAAAGLVIAIDAGDVVGSATASPAPMDGRPFRIRVSGKYNSHTSQNLTVKIYQVPNAIFTAGTQATLGNDNVIVTTSTLAAGSGANNFDVVAKLVWDAASKALNANLLQESTVGGTAATAAAQTAVTSVNQTDLNFLVTFTWSSGTAADLIGPFDFYAERA
jgi:hypothetical protein